MTEAQQLRDHARALRESAQYAERSMDAKQDLNTAAQLEARADALEGIVKTERPRPALLTPEEREQRRRENHKRAFAQLEAVFGKAKRPYN